MSSGKGSGVPPPGVKYGDHSYKCAVCDAPYPLAELEKQNGALKCRYCLDEEYKK